MAEQQKPSTLQFGSAGHTYESCIGKGAPIPVGYHTGKAAAVVLQLEQTAPGGDSQHTLHYLQRKRR